MKKLIFMLLALPLLFGSCDDDEPETMIIDSSLPQGEFTAARTGNFVDENEAGSTGSAALGTDADGDQFVRFGEGFNTALGTGTVTVFLSTSATFMADPMNGNPNLLVLGPVKSSGVNFFKVPEGESTAKYTHVILWCGSAAIPFGNASS